MRKTILALACFCSVSVFFTHVATAQTEDIAASTIKQSNESLRPPAIDIKKQKPEESAEQPTHHALYDTDTPPAPSFFPTDLRNLLPSNTAPSKLIFGLLGLMLLGLRLALVSKQKNQSVDEQ